MLGILKPCSGPMKSSLGLGSDPSFPSSAAHFRIRSQFTCSFVSNLLPGNAGFVLTSRMLLYAFLLWHFSHCSGLLLLSAKALQQEAALSQKSRSIFSQCGCAAPGFLFLSVQGPSSCSISAWCYGEHWVWSQTTRVPDLILLHPFCMTFSNTFKLMRFFTWKWG